jgi:hypothetical protein
MTREIIYLKGKFSEYSPSIISLSWIPINLDECVGSRVYVCREGFDCEKDGKLKEIIKKNEPFIPRMKLENLL